MRSNTSRTIFKRVRLRVNMFTSYVHKHQNNNLRNVQKITQPIMAKNIEMFSMCLTKKHLTITEYSLSKYCNILYTHLSKYCFQFFSLTDAQW